MKLSKKWLMILALTLSLTMATAGTLAFLTDRDTVENTFTLGNVDIEVEEVFEPDSPLNPGVEVEKQAGIKNVHNKSDAWVWMTVSVPAELDECIELGWADDADPIKLDDPVHEGYVSYLVKHPTALEPDESTPKYLESVTLSDKVDYQDGAYVVVENGEITATISDLNDVKIIVDGFATQTEGFTSVDEAYAGYTDQWSGLNGGESGANGGAIFISAEDFDVTDEGKKQAYDDEISNEVLDLLQAGNDLYIDEASDLLGFNAAEVDAQGATVTLNGTGPEAYGYLAFIPDAGTDMELSNLNVTGSGFIEVGHYGMGGGNYTVDNLKIEDLASTLSNTDKGFTLGCAFMAFGDVVLNDCVMTGTTALQDGVLPVDLACGQAWSGYKDDDDNKISTTVNGGEYGTVYCWSHALVTINGAEIDKLYVSPINGSVTIKAGSNVGTINVDYGTSDAGVTKARLQKLVIEEGATVDQIVFRNNTYTVSEWNAFVSAF